MTTRTTALYGTDRQSPNQNRYSDESGHTSCPRSTSNIWLCQKPDLHEHLQHAHQLSNCNDFSWSSRRQGMFEIPKNPRNLTGAFSFIADELYNLATAMVFGLTALASSWEAFRRAIEALTKVFANSPNLVIKHMTFIDMLKWEEIDPSTKLTPVYSCNINCGIMDDAGNQMDLPACICVDNTLMLALDVDHMKMVLAATIKAIFAVMGEPDVAARQCPLAMDKWLELVIGPKQTMLGLIINTSRLTIAIPAKYLHEVLDLLNST
jgi:hypothetical protein